MISSPEPASCYSCMTGSHHLFRHLNETELQEIMFHKTTETYKRGSIVYHEGQRKKGFHCVQSGIVKIYKTGFDGKEQIIRFAKSGDIIGYRSLISDEPACTTTQILEDAVLCHIPKEFLTKLIRTNGGFAEDLIKLTCKELGEANSYLTNIAQKTVRERLAEVLIHLDQQFESDPEGILGITLTREELSNVVGTATESIIRLLSEFKGDGLIGLKGRKIKILDKPGLRSIANI